MLKNAISIIACMMFGASWATPVIVNDIDAWEGKIFIDSIGFSYFRDADWTQTGANFGSKKGISNEYAPVIKAVGRNKVRCVITDVGLAGFLFGDSTLQAEIEFDTAPLVITPASTRVLFNGEEQKIASATLFEGYEKFPKDGTIKYDYVGSLQHTAWAKVSSKLDKASLAFSEASLIPKLGVAWSLSTGAISILTSELANLVDRKTISSVIFKGSHFVEIAERPREGDYWLFRMTAWGKLYGTNIKIYDAKYDGYAPNGETIIEQIKSVEMNSACKIEYSIDRGPETR